MWQVLGYSDINEANIFDMSMKLLKVLNADDNQYNMSVVNKLYGEKTFTIKQVTDKNNVKFWDFEKRMYFKFLCISQEILK